MKDIRLKNLILRDFQGGTVTLDGNGENVFIFSANAGGKTRLVSGFSWLLFNKDALGRSDFEIKNLDIQGEAIHGLEHSVEGILDINGQSINLKKIYKEKWSKKRGNATKEFSGHLTEYFIDGVPIQEKDYFVRISEIAGDETQFRLLTSPMTFANLHWQKQRALLLEVCGDISDADVIGFDEKLIPLTAILQKHTLDDHRKIVISRRSEINKEMERIPIRIDEVRHGIPVLTGIDRQEAEKEVHHFETAINDAKLRFQGVNTGGNIASLTAKLFGINAEIRSKEDLHRSKSLSTLNHLNQEISQLSEEVNASGKRIIAINGDLKLKESDVQRIEADLSHLREKWIAIDKEIFKGMTAKNCPACGQSLPIEKIQESREKALAIFNETKAEKLGEVNQKGKAFKDQKDKINGEINALKSEQGKLEITLTGMEDELQKAEKERDLIKITSKNFSEILGYADLLAQSVYIDLQIKKEREDKMQDVEKIKAEIATLQIAFSSAKARIDAFTLRDQGEKRIEELKTEEKRLVSEFERLENELFLTEQFIKTKVSLLTDKINGKFEMVRFKLFNQLINGGIEEVCEITVNGVPFNAGLNSAARTQAGMDIIRTLQEFYQMRAPIFIDNRESCTLIPKMESQVISLYVSPEDKTLRIELEGDPTNIESGRI